MKRNKMTGYIPVIIAAMFAAALIGHARPQQQQTLAPPPAPAPAHDQSHSTCPMMRAQEVRKDDAVADPHQDGGTADSMAEMNIRGEREMGFSQEKTTHHFRLTKDGGAIEVEVNDPKDRVTLYHIRQHLAEIAQAFSDGDFSKPFAVHDQLPPGVPAMKQLRAEIEYEYQETERGGRVRIRTSNSEALSAIHEFLRFQINEHRTGDPME